MKKFVVVGLQRTGTTFIRTMIDSHPKIRCIGEAFYIAPPWRGSIWRSPEIELGYSTYAKRSARRMAGHFLWQKNQIGDYLNELFDLPGYDAIGFKIMYNQLLQFRSVLEHIRTHRLHIIHVVRKNALKKIVSELSVKKRGYAHSTNSVGAVKVTVPTKNLEAKLTQINKENDKLKALFSDTLPYIRIYYEDFIEDNEKEINKILEFLQLDYHTLSSKLKKLNPDDLSQVIENIEEVRLYLNTTPYTRYLEASY